MNKRKKDFILFFIFMILIIISFIFNIKIGKNVGKNFYIFAKEMVLILPPAFILIGLFNVWISKERIEKSFGEKSGIIKYFYAIALAATTVGGTFVAFPFGNTLYHKGAGYEAIFTYITAASLFMIPMSLMEASILGVKFTILRLLISVPLIIISSKILSKYLNSKNYKLPNVE